MQQPNGQQILILGLGISGLAMARWCVRQGAQVVVADTRAEPPALSQLRSELPSVRFFSGPLAPGLLDAADVQAVFASPGLTPASTAALQEAASVRGVRWGGEIDLFSRALEALGTERGYRPVLLAVTGTNGKTTVTSLTGRLVEAAGRSVAVAGNIGPSLLDTLGRCLDRGELPAVWVLELSSFQLAASTGFEPTAAALLNVSQDHLDWHGSMPAYLAAKVRVFGRHGLMVLNRDDAAVYGLAQEAGRRRRLSRSRVSFGSDVPTQAGDFGLQSVHGVTWLVRAVAAAPEARRQRRPDAGSECAVQRLMPADALRIRGRHNALNALAALALGCAAGCGLAPMLHALRDYRGEPHRVESVGVLDGIEYFDDSKGTNVGATVAAVQGLGQERPLVVILGGDGKGQDFTPLVEPVARHARAAVLIGRDGQRIRELLRTAGLPLIDAASMNDAVRAAAAAAQGGDAVLLSPACASFDMFRDYEQRAQAFREAVSELALERGAMLEGSA